MKIRLDEKQSDKLSDLSLGLGQLLFGSTVLPFMIPLIDKPLLVVLIFGIVSAIGLWIFALWIVWRR